MTADLTQGDVLAGHASAVRQIGHRVIADVIEVGRGPVHVTHKVVAELLRPDQKPVDPAAAMHEQPKGGPR
jgi:hypothetical protein